MEATTPGRNALDYVARLMLDTLYRPGDGKNSKDRRSSDGPKCSNTGGMQNSRSFLLAVLERD
jgi:hypothetical protein